MGCGKAHFGQKGQKNTQNLKFWSQSLFPGTSRQPAHEKNFETKIFLFRCFLALPTKMSFTTPHYYPKYEVWAIEISANQLVLFFLAGANFWEKHAKNRRKHAKNRRFFGANFFGGKIGRC